MLTSKIIVVTGGAGLLGSSFSRAIARQGAVVVIADIDIEAANSVAQDITTSHAGKAQAEILNITDKTSVCSLIDRVKVQYGRIDAVVNNAYPRNRGYGRKLEDVTYADFCENASLHLGGYFLVAQQFSLFFRQQGCGNIVNMASIYGALAPRFEIYADTPMTMPVEYAAIKSGVIHLTRYFAQYFKADQIRVNCLSPGGIIDNQPESFLREYKRFCGEKGMLEPTDIVGALLFLLSDGSQYMTGQNLIVDDGFSL